MSHNTMLVSILVEHFYPLYFLFMLQMLYKFDEKDSRATIGYKQPPIISSFFTHVGSNFYTAESSTYRSFRCLFYLSAIRDIIRRHVY